MWLKRSLFKLQLIYLISIAKSQKRKTCYTLKPYCLNNQVQFSLRKVQERDWTSPELHCSPDIPKMEVELCWNVWCILLASACSLYIVVCPTLMNSSFPIFPSLSMSNASKTLLACAFPSPSVQPWVLVTIYIVLTKTVPPQCTWTAYIKLKISTISSGVISPEPSWSYMRNAHLHENGTYVIVFPGILVT